MPSHAVSLDRASMQAQMDGNVKVNGNVETNRSGSRHLERRMDRRPQRISDSEPSHRLTFGRGALTWPWQRKLLRELLTNGRLPRSSSRIGSVWLAWRKSARRSKKLRRESPPVCVIKMHQGYRRKLQIHQDHVHCSTSSSRLLRHPRSPPRVRSSAPESPRQIR